MLSDDTIVGLRRTKEYGRSYGGAHKVDTSRKEVIAKMRDAHSKRKQLKQGASNRKKLSLQKKKKKIRNCIRKYSEKRRGWM